MLCETSFVLFNFYNLTAYLCAKLLIGDPTCTWACRYIAGVKTHHAGCVLVTQGSQTTLTVWRTWGEKTSFSLIHINYTCKACTQQILKGKCQMWFCDYLNIILQIEYTCISQTFYQNCNLAFYSSYRRCKSDNTLSQAWRFLMAEWLYFTLAKAKLSLLSSTIKCWGSLCV